MTAAQADRLRVVGQANGSFGGQKHAIPQPRPPRGSTPMTATAEPSASVGLGGRI